MEIMLTDACVTTSRYVQEYNAAAAVVANRNRTYVAYIDSLVYMRPRHIRTKLFHEILISYLAFCKGKGFEYAHIWACPTTRGGDFIYWCHPSFQKNPGKDRLLQWYLAMVEKAKQAGVAFSCEDLYTTSFKSLEDQLEQQLPPYFDGDYWAAEVERLHANPPKRGKLSKEKYEESLRGEKFRKKLVESVRLSRESLFVIALQPKCSTCNTLVINSSCWKVCDTQAFVCDACKAPDAIDVQILEPPSFVKSCENVDEEEVSCPFVDYRADLLKNCEEHHYQFDSFRRAKYSTMMLIYHIASTQRAVPRTDASV
jgi:E1A/CREB-binding protein